MATATPPAPAKTYRKNSHCSYCGNAFPADAPWPRRCAVCDNWSFVNPIPVAVAVVPVDGGVLAVRRNIEPRKGSLSLPGGYIELGESWQQAAAREVWEEAGVRIDAATLREFRVFSAPEGAIIICCLAAPLRLADLDVFSAGDEATERVVLTQPAEMTFPLHTEIVADFFAGRLPPPTPPQGTMRSER
jgi:ADP-ribose pyrophosphatase YjhB (NUDIX family)